MLLVVACTPPPNATFQVRESLEQLHVTHAEPGATLELVDAKRAVLATATVDALGSAMFRQVPPGDGYVVKAPASRQFTRALTVKPLDAERPAALLQQTLKPGLNYLRMRDGVTLSAFVTLPGSIEGRYPTVVNYSGYAASKPGTPNKDFEFLCGDLPVLCAPPEDGTALFAATLGYATVSVNVRGTGCSGGAYDYFERLQVLDGHDVVDLVAAQPWVAHHQVGMVGLSYPGITQLFVAADTPAGLAAIAPMSVIGNTATTLLPGGMLNDGFALTWVDAVLSKAVPYGQGWERGRVDAGDTECEENQLLHGQLVDNVAQARVLQFYEPSLHDRFNPTRFVDRIEVPVFLTGSWQDEQTGPFFFTLFDRFTKSPAKRLNAINGVHIDGLSPWYFAEWHAFLELFVARRLPKDPGTLRAIAPFAFEGVFGSKLSLPETKWAKFPSYAEALAAWKAEPPVLVRFESGAGVMGDPGAPESIFSLGFESWPPPAQRPWRLFLHGDGSLTASMPATGEGASSFLHHPEAGQLSQLAAGGNPWAKLPPWTWRQPEAGGAVVHVSEPLENDVVLVGNASVDLWVRSTATEADLEVTLSEVRPDGKETFVQAGWLRASHRKAGPNATTLWPDHTFEQKDAAPLVPGDWTLARVETGGIGHVFHQGSRVRLEVDTPGGTRAEWFFALAAVPEGTRHTIGHDAVHPSSVVLPVVEGAQVPSPAPPCPGLRGQPCRAFVPFTNTPAP